jgi:hypothetical protein
LFLGNRLKRLISFARLLPLFARFGPPDRP